MEHCGKMPDAREELSRSVREGRIESSHSIKSLEGTVIINAKHDAMVERGRLSCLVTRACQNTKASFSLLPICNRQCSAPSSFSSSCRYSPKNNISKNWCPICVLCPVTKNAGRTPVAKNTDTHPFPPCSTWLSAVTHDMHYSVDDHRRHCCRLHKKKIGSPYISRHARSESCIRQCGPSTTARLCLQHQHTGSNPSLAPQLYAEQTNQCSFSATKV